MYGALIGELASLPYEYRRPDPLEGDFSLLEEQPQKGAAESERGYSGTTVLTAAVQEGLLLFERRLPELLKNGGESAKQLDALFREEISSAMKRFGRSHPLAGYPMDLSIWLLRDGTSGDGSSVEITEDPGAAARACSAAWAFQDDLYRMRHMAVLLAGITGVGRESVKAADAAACTAFLALHGCTKNYIVEYIRRQFGYQLPEEGALEKELLAEGGSCPPSLAFRAAFAAFLRGQNYEDVVRRAICSAGGSARENVSVIGLLAGCFAEAAGFKIPEELIDLCRQRLPEDLRRSADAFAEAMEQRRERRENDPKAMERWKSAMTRASSLHPAAVQGNEPLERALRVLNEKKDRQSFVAALELLRLRMNGNARVFVPIAGAERRDLSPASGGNQSNQSAAAASGEDRGVQTPGSAVRYRMQAVRIRDGSLWQPVYTGREQLNRALEAAVRPHSEETEEAPRTAGSGLVLSYALRPLLERFLPSADGEEEQKDSPAVSSRIRGIVINPFDCPLFLPRKTIEAILRTCK